MHSNRHDGAPVGSFLSQCSRMNDDREGILVRWPVESPIWFSGSSLCHVECEWHSNLRDLETNYTGCSTTSVQGFRMFSTYQHRTFQEGTTPAPYAEGPRSKLIFVHGPAEDRGGTVVKVLCYKPEGCWFDPSWCHWIFHWHKNPSHRTMALASTQPLTEMSTRGIS